VVMHDVEWLEEPGSSGCEAGAISKGVPALHGSGELQRISNKLFWREESRERAGSMSHSPDQGPRMMEQRNRLVTSMYPPGASRG
jgi:hypothetical protein